MIVFYCPRASTGLRVLVDRIRATGGHAIRVSRRRAPTPGETWINWGNREFCAGMINGNPPENKFAELLALQQAGVPTVPHNVTRAPGWLGRTLYHHEARDLLNPPAQPDYWVAFVPTDWEMRFHVVNGRSILAGTKRPREGFRHPHPRFRSYRGGWSIRYGRQHRPRNDNQVNVCREASIQAVRAAGLDFGAVDVGWRTNGGGPVVFEVNLQPGLEVYSAGVYAQAFMWAWGT